jgi:Amt family ammonium transporter
MISSLIVDNSLSSCFLKVACGSGGITVLFVWKFHPTGGKWSLSKIINGCLAGMVSVCAGCNAYYPWIASGIASVAGVVYVSLSLLMVKLKIDDPLDAVAVHAGAGK